MPVFFRVRRKREARPALEFLVLFPVVALTLWLAQAQHVESWQTMGMPVLLAMLEMNVAALQGIVMPLLLLIGVDIAIFTHQASGWVAGSLTERIPRGFPQAVLLAALAWRLHQGVSELMGRLATSTPADEAIQYAGALGIPLAAFAVWALVGRRAEGEDGPTPDGVLEAAERWGFPMILAYIGVQLAGTVLVLFAQSIPMTPLTAAIQAVAVSLTGLMNQALTTPWHLAVNAAALVGAVVLARRGRRSAALYLGIFGVMHLWFEATNPGRPLSTLGWRGAEPEDFWWTVLFSGVALLWLARGRLTAERATVLLGLVTMTWLLRQTELLDDPYSPLFFGYSGIGFLAFGILWDVLTAGSWANRDTGGLPRVSRVLMYVGYVLLTVTVVNWALTSHDLTSVGQFTGDTAMVGLERFGKPLLYGIIMLTLAAAFRRPEPRP